MGDVMSKTQKYRVVSPLLHDGEGYQPGDEVALTEGEAAPLLAANVVEAPAPASEKAETEGGDAEQAPEGGEAEQSAEASESEQPADDGKADGQKAAQKGKKGGKGK